MDGQDRRISRRAWLAGAGATLAWSASPARALLSLVAERPLPETVEALIPRMTLAEKAGQLNLLAAAWAGGAATSLNPAGAASSFDTQLRMVRRGELTGVFNGNGAEMARRMQTEAVRRSRLKIPLLFAADVIHGLRTVFPVPLAEAASFDPIWRAGPPARRRSRRRHRGSTGPLPPWSTSPATPGGGGASRVRARMCCSAG